MLSAEDWRWRRWRGRWGWELDVHLGQHITAQDGGIGGFHEGGRLRVVMVMKGIMGCGEVVRWGVGIQREFGSRFY